MSGKKKIAVIGTGGFGREVYYLLNSEIYECVGFIDHSNDEGKLPAPIIGHESDMGHLMAEFSFSHCVIAIGEMKKRKEIFSQIKCHSLIFPVLADLSVTNFSNEEDNGSILYPGVVVMNDSSIGKFTLLNSGVTLGHDVVIGDFCNINPGVHIAGKVNIGNGTLIGIGASIKEETVIGCNSVVGAGSVVLNDIPDNTTVYGVPALPASKG